MYRSFVKKPKAVAMPSTNEATTSTAGGKKRHSLVPLLLVFLSLAVSLSLIVQFLDLGTATIDKTVSTVVMQHERPYNYSDVKTRSLCYAQRDVGILAAVNKSARTFCGDGGWDSVHQAPMSAKKATKITMYEAKGGIKTATFQNLMLDLYGVQIHKPIESVAQDGGDHNPLFRYNPIIVNCACDELANYFLSITNLKKRWAKQIWQLHLEALPKRGNATETFCLPSRAAKSRRSLWDFVKDPLQPPDPNKLIVFEDPVVLITRRDDHNPFFQISVAFNSWIMLQVLGWDVTKTRVIHFDGGFPSPIDALHQQLLAPNFPIIKGTSLMGKRVHFRGSVVIAPYESRGPLMEHLNNDEPCHDSALIKSFRAQSLVALNVTPEMERELADTSRRPMIVTVITRRPIRGRTLQRMWVNEDEILALMRIQYKSLNVLIRSVEYANLTLYDQITTTIESDMIVGMHGAGLVNVLWTRPGTTVVEIFPKLKFRWGYRNLCQFLGCDWHEFRGGEDLGPDPAPETKNKRIIYDEWMTFFHPLFNEMYTAYLRRRASD
ncbi:hypothetical protein CCR75_005582 [Bremia lactucae]|uniref:Glycosyltransferase 61 catalytic domain-containing protein n=1 Tax=Bremia lactucae TaxID=4779 RepID=A0A976IL53_BRELC|nr:hypothetical protein CCR75_005582 [Bremia lactucae]